MKQLIVNADDLGLSKNVNKGIIEAHKKGVVTSAAVMVNMPGFKDAVRLLKKNKALDAGLHLNLTWGKPLTRPHSMVGKDGNFLPGMKKRLLLGKFGWEEAREELRAQVEAAKKKFKVSHVNSHQHFHVFPKLMKMVADIARNNGIRWIRLPSESFSLRLNRQLPKMIMLNLYSRKASRYYKEAGLRHPDHTFGVMDTGNMTLESFKKLLSLVKDGVNEIMCHPGHMDNEIPGCLKKSREKELGILTNPGVKSMAKDLKIKLTNFGGIR